MIKRGINTLLFMMLFFFTGSTLVYAEEPADMVRILAFSPPRNWNMVTSDFLAGLEDGLEEMQTPIELSIYETFSNSELTQEEYEIGMVQALKPDYVVLTAAAQYLCEFLEKEEIPFFLYDGDKEDSDRLAYVGLDNEELGKQAARLALDAIPEEEIHALILRVNENSNSMERQKGFLSIVETEERFWVDKVYCAMRDLEQCRKYLEELLENENKLNFIFCEDSLMAHTAAQVLEEMHLTEEIKIIGVDLNDYTRPFLKKGVIQVILDPDFYQMGKVMAEIIGCRDDLRFPVTRYIEGQIITGEDLP